MRGLCISCKFHDPRGAEENVRAGWEAAEVCARMGIPALRVFGNDIPDKARAAETIAFACQGIRKVCERAADQGVQTLLEVHGDFNTVEAMRLVAQEMAARRAWHPLGRRAQRQDLRRRLPALLCGRAAAPAPRPHQGLPPRGERAVHPLPVGEGDIPLPEIVRTLLRDGYDGYFSLEWEKKWVPSLAEPEEVFPAFVRYMRAL